MVWVLPKDGLNSASNFHNDPWFNFYTTMRSKRLILMRSNSPIWEQIYCPTFGNSYLSEVTLATALLLQLQFSLMKSTIYSFSENARHHCLKLITTEKGIKLINMSYIKSPSKENLVIWMLLMHESYAVRGMCFTTVKKLRGNVLENSCKRMLSGTFKSLQLNGPSNCCLQVSRVELVGIHALSV